MPFDSVLIEFESWSWPFDHVGKKQNCFKPFLISFDVAQVKINTQIVLSVALKTIGIVLFLLLPISLSAFSGGHERDCEIRIIRVEEEEICQPTKLAERERKREKENKILGGRKKPSSMRSSSFV